MILSPYGGKKMKTVFVFVSVELRSLKPKDTVFRRPISPIYGNIIRSYIARVQEKLIFSNNAQHIMETMKEEHTWTKRTPCKVKI